MSEKQKTFYELLGVKQEASQHEIKSAYRSMSKHLHPDVNEAEDAEEQFTKLREAYSVLSDEASRSEYDVFLEREEMKKTGSPDIKFEFQDAFEMFFNKRHQQLVPVAGKDIDHTIEITVQDILQEAEKKIRVSTKRICLDCEGDGLSNKMNRCKTCMGVGTIQKQKNTPFGKIDFREDCEPCQGKGYMRADECKTCRGTGELPDDKHFTFRVPINAHFGEVLVFKGHGAPGRNGGKTGDLRVYLKQMQYDRYIVEDQINLAERKVISLRDVLLENPIPFVFPDGREEMIQPPKEIRTGDRMTFEGEGMYTDNTLQRGMYCVDFHVDIPRLHEQQRKQILSILDKGAE